MDKQKKNALQILRRLLTYAASPFFTKYLLIYESRDTIMCLPAADYEEICINSKVRHYLMVMIIWQIKDRPIKQVTACKYLLVGYHFQSSTHWLNQAKDLFIRGLKASFENVNMVTTMCQQL